MPALARLFMILAGLAMILPGPWKGLVEICQDHGKPTMASVAGKEPGGVSDEEYSERFKTPGRVISKGIVSKVFSNDVYTILTKNSISKQSHI